MERTDRLGCLVICPKTLMVTAWGDDIEKFAPRATVKFAYAPNRTPAFFAMKTDFTILNHDGVKWFTDKKGKLTKEATAILKQYDHLIIDEYDAYKNPTSQRSKAMLSVARFFKIRRGMSGTPGGKSVTDLFHPTRIIDDGERLGDNFFHFRNKTQIATQIGPDPKHVRWDDAPGMPQAVATLLSDITIRHEFEQVMTHVPPNHRNYKDFFLSKRAQGIYDTLQRDSLVAFDDNAPITAIHAASLRNKLLQTASGAVYDGSGGFQVVDDTRYELIVELSQEVNHSVVFFNWKHQRELLAKFYKAAGREIAIIDGEVASKRRDDIVRDYQAGNLNDILLHPNTGAHGLTLTRGTLTVLSSPIYESDKLKQGIHRIYRGTQDQVTNTVMVRAKNTVEDLVYERLEGRYQRMSELHAMMRDRIGAT